MKISEAFDLYINHMIVEGQSKRSVEHTEYIKRRIIAFTGDISVSKLDLKTIYDWRASMEYKRLNNGELIKRKQNSLRYDVIRLRGMLKYIEMTGVKCTHYELVPIPKREDTLREYLSPEEVKMVIDAAYSIRNKFVVSFLYSSGVRVSEFVSLDRDSVKDRRFSVVGKGRKMRVCFIDERTEELMELYLKSRKDKCRALVVSDLYKDRVSVGTVQLIVKNAAKRAGIDKHITPHTFRHSFATNFIENNGGVLPLSKMLGHASLDTTSIYTHIVNNELQRQYNCFHTI